MWKSWSPRTRYVVVVIVMMVIGIVYLKTSGPSVPDTDAQFVAALRSSGMVPSSSKDQDLATVGHLTCDQLKKGLSLSDIKAAVEKSGGTSDAVAQVVDLSVKYVCPDQASKLSR